jgi:dTDP-glucose 4,6-dehydratase
MPVTANLASGGDRRRIFIRGDIHDQPLVERLLAQHRPRTVITLLRRAMSIAPSTAPRIHSDEYRWHFSLAGVRTRPLAAAARYGDVSTDEVSGSLGSVDPAFSQSTAYALNCPYASKALSK